MIQYSIGRVGRHFGVGDTDGVRIGALHLHGGILGAGGPHASETTDFAEFDGIYATEAQGSVGGR